MSEALKILNNIRTLRAQARECTLETLEEMLEKLEVVVNERREEDSQAQAEIEERTRKLQIDVQLRTSEHRSMYSYVRLSIDRCTATYV